ncbi:MAG TPA: isocitrate lyase/phosphoenolpyruvate mutase family protein [Acidimicrobiales bacterium]|nr:isocitrate lyase/phosphoenolpyruvate mutase family protein [Acidimicrobiales bacterium]
MSEPAPSLASTFLSMHVPGSPLLMPNPWDVGSARLLASLGFRALATTSSGQAATLGRLDGRVSRDEAIASAAAIASALADEGVPVSADLEHGFADAPEGVAETARFAMEAGLAGFSIEDSTGVRDSPIYDFDLAVERVAAAASVVGSSCVLTARCERYLHGQRDLDEVIRRLQAFSSAGAHVLFAPGVVSADEIRTVIGSVDKPVSVLAMPGCPPVAELASLGVARVSVGGAFAYASLGALVDAAVELRDNGTYEYLAMSAPARDTARTAFRDR